MFMSAHVTNFMGENLQFCSVMFFVVMRLRWKVKLSWKSEEGMF